MLKFINIFNDDLIIINKKVIQIIDKNGKAFMVLPGVNNASVLKYMEYIGMMPIVISCLHYIINIAGDEQNMVYQVWNSADNSTFYSMEFSNVIERLK